MSYFFLVNLSLVVTLSFATHLDASRRFVLSGGPCIGKSTVLKELSKRGYQTIPEVFTLLFEQAVQHNALESFFADPDKLPFYLLDEQLRLESLLHTTVPAFLDRGAVDIIAYGDYFNSPMTQELRMAAFRNYDLVFFLEPLPDHLYVNSAVRKESPEEARILHEHLKQAYRAQGYQDHQIIDVPFGTPAQRTQYILDTIMNAYLYIDRADSQAHSQHLPFAGLLDHVKITTL